MSSRSGAPAEDAALGNVDELSYSELEEIEELKQLKEEGEDSNAPRSSVEGDMGLSEGEEDSADAGSEGVAENVPDDDAPDDDAPDDLLDDFDDDDFDESDLAAIEAARSEALDAAFKRKKKKKKRVDMMLAAAKELHKESVSDEVVVRFDHVTKTYRLYKNDRDRILGLFKPNRGNPRTINANDDISFEIRKGEAVAFMGLNGAGKSTALKMASGVAFPTSGTIEVNGRISALLELRAGFDSRLTGRENIRLRGMILGLSKEEIKEIEPRVVEFADIGNYIDQPMRLYSSGMKARVGFGLSVSLDPEVLIVDEALSVGDRRFRRKCIARIRDIMTDENVTVLFVTHSTSTAKAFCTRGIVLDHGKKVFDGPFEDASEFYSENIIGD